VPRFAGTHLGVRIAVATAGAAAILLAGGCGAGQIAETATIESAVPGANGQAVVPQDPSQVNSGNGLILVKNVTIDYVDPAGYAKGGKAPLDLRIINNSDSDVELVGASSPDGTIVLGGKDVAPPPAATASASPSGTPSANPSASPSEAPAPQPAPAPETVKIPANQIVDLSVGAGKFLLLTGLARDLRPGDTTSLTFSFRDTSFPAGSISDIVLEGVPLAPPTVAASRSAVPNEGTEN
jgi:hypothetical protein